MGVTIAKKKSFNDWITIEEGVRLKIDYPELGDQEQNLSDALLDYAGGKIPLKNYQRYRNLYLRYTIKDWEGIKDSDGKPVECKLINNMLEINLWHELIHDSNTASFLFEKINAELENTESDKKK